MHLALQHHPSYSSIAADGDLDRTTVDGVLDVFSLVPLEQSLIVDLRAVGAIDAAAAAALVDELTRRARVGEVIVVVDDVQVAATLVLEDLHHVVPFVRHFDDAVTLATGIVMAGR